MSEIKRLYVHSTAHGNGIGGALIGALEVEAVARGLESVTLEASPSSLSFYERRRHVARVSERLVVGDAVFHFTVMRRDLAW